MDKFNIPYEPWVELTFFDKNKIKLVTKEFACFKFNHDKVPRSAEYFEWNVPNKSEEYGEKFLAEVLSRAFYPFTSRNGFNFTFRIDQLKDDFVRFLTFVTMIRYVYEIPLVVIEYFRLRDMGMSIDQALLVAYPSASNKYDIHAHYILESLRNLKTLHEFDFKKAIFDNDNIETSIEATLRNNSKYFIDHPNQYANYIFNQELFNEFNKEFPDNNKLGFLLEKCSGRDYEVLA